MANDFEWIAVAELQDGSKWFYDKKRTERKGNYVKYWVVENSTSGKGYKSQLLLLQSDCDKAMYRSLAVSYRSESLGSGDVLGYGAEPGEWRSVSKGAADEHAHAYACTPKGWLLIAGGADGSAIYVNALTIRQVHTGAGRRMYYQELVDVGLEVWNQRQELPRSVRTQNEIDCATGERSQLSGVSFKTLMGYGTPYFSSDTIIKKKAAEPLTSGAAVSECVCISYLSDQRYIDVMSH